MKTSERHPVRHRVLVYGMLQFYGSNFLVFHGKDHKSSTLRKLLSLLWCSLFPESSDNFQKKGKTCNFLVGGVHLHGKITLFINIPRRCDIHYINVALFAGNITKTFTNIH